MTIDQIFRGITARLIVLIFCMVVTLGLLILRLWHEQVHRGPKHRKAISMQSVRRIRIPPVRGRLFCSDGKLLTDNVPVYDALFHIHELRQPGRYGFVKTATVLYEHLDRTAKIIGREFDTPLKTLKRHVHIYPALPFEAFEDLDEMEMARLFEWMPGIQGLEIATRMKRIYPMGATGAHILGFVGRKDPNLEEERSKYSYFLPELTGRTGLEKLFEEHLKGMGGAKLVQVDSMGFFYDEVGKTKPPQSGNDVILTVDSRAQSIAQELLENKRGAMVVLNCNTGAVLAIVSSPTYNLNNLTGRTYANLANDEKNLPLLNRSIAGGYSPGSIIKPIIGMAALNEKVYGVNKTHHCLGYYQIGDTKIHCSSTQGHGTINLVQALETSCNSYFIDAGINVGVDRLSAYLSNAGIGHDPGLEIAIGGSSGLLPSRGMKERRMGRHWTTFDTALISIGQGLVTLSPLQAAVFTAAIANGGTVYRPTLVRAIKDARGYYIKIMKPEVREKLWVSPRYLQRIREGLIRTVSGEHGTGSLAKTPAIELAGKTGTAEIGSGNNKRKNVWFVCYGPADSPRYSIAILIENGVSGGTTAAPLAKQFFERYLSAIGKRDSKVSSHRDIDQDQSQVELQTQIDQ